MHRIYFGLHHVKVVCCVDACGRNTLSSGPKESKKPLQLLLRNSFEDRYSFVRSYDAVSICENAVSSTGRTL